MTELCVTLASVSMADVPEVGGKNASLGEMIGELAEAGVRVPGGFATTAQAYRDFLRANALEPRLDALFADLDAENTAALAEAGRRARKLICAGRLPAPLEDAIREHYAALGENVPVAVRSSATAEDLPEASFAGQQESFLNVRGAQAVVEAVKRAYASLFTDRAIVYRVRNGFDHRQVALSAGVQRMVRSDIGAAGVAFTLDTESGFAGVIAITAAYGLGEAVVQGLVNPDEYVVYKANLDAGLPAVLRRELGGKRERIVLAEDGGTRQEAVPDAQQARFALDESEIEALARQCQLIERHYGRPMDIEWGRDGEDGRLYILQARPETVASRGRPATASRFRLGRHGAELARGHAVGRRIGAGPVHVAQTLDDARDMAAGSVLVTDITDPDWGPQMKRAAAIVTNRGGRACHAAIVARELGIPAVVGTLDGTDRIPHGEPVTVSCAEGEAGYVYAGQAEFEETSLDASALPELPVDLMLNLADPGRAFELASLPVKGVGLARIEFIINNMIGIHPRAALKPAALEPAVAEELRARTAAYANPVEYYVSRLAQGIATIAAAFAPRPVIVRTSDFKSNEYANLLGGRGFEPREENPMIGFRGAGRYVADEFRACFELECRALRRVRDEMGLTNVQVMIPFLRTLDEARAVTKLLAANGLERGKNDLKLIMMCEVPSNAILADDFLQHFDGYSIGSNDLTQLTLGIDRDSAQLAAQFDERDPAVQALMSLAIQACRQHHKYIGICGQGPSDHPDLAHWLLDQGIGSLSLNPDTVIETWLFLGGVTGDKATAAA